MEANVKQEIRDAINAYGHLISIFQEVSGEQFSQMIANTYDCKDARNKYFCNILFNIFINRFIKIQLVYYRNSYL